MALVQKNQIQPGNPRDIDERDFKRLYLGALVLATPVIIGTALLVATSASSVRLRKEIKPPEKPSLVAGQMKSITLPSNEIDSLLSSLYESISPELQADLKEVCKGTFSIGHAFDRVQLFLGLNGMINDWNRDGGNVPNVSAKDFNLHYPPMYEANIEVLAIDWFVKNGVESSKAEKWVREEAKSSGLAPNFEARTHSGMSGRNYRTQEGGD